MKWKDRAFVEGLRERTDMGVGGTLTYTKTNGDQVTVTFGYVTISGSTHYGIDPTSVTIKSALGTDLGWPVGTVVTTEITLRLIDTARELSQYNLNGAAVTLYLRYVDREGNVYIKTMPTHYVSTADDYNSATVEITCLEGLAYKSEEAIASDFWGSLTYPITLADLAAAALQRIGYQSAPTGYLNSTITIASAPEGIETYRDLLGHIGSLCGGNYRLNVNSVPEFAYPNEWQPSSTGLTGEIYNWVDRPLWRLQAINLGCVTATYEAADETIVTVEYANPMIRTEAQCTLDLSDNPLIPVLSLSPYSAFRAIYNKYQSKINACEGTCLSAPYVEPGDRIDICYTDYPGGPRQTVCRTIITEVEHQINGPTWLACTIRPTAGKYT